MTVSQDVRTLEWAADVVKEHDGGDMATTSGWRSDEYLNLWQRLNAFSARLKKHKAREWRGKCPHCEGEGVAHSDGGWIDCPDCNGTGEAQP